MSVSKSVLPIIGQRAKKRDLYKYKRAHTSLDAVSNDARKAAMDFLRVFSQCARSGASKKVPTVPLTTPPISYITYEHGPGLGMGNDNSQTRLRSGTERDSPSTAEKSLVRSTIELAELYPTTSANSKTDSVVNVQVRNSAAFLSSANKREATEENIE